jgi:Exostosin family
MAQVLLLSAAPVGSGDDYNRGAFRNLRESAQLDTFHKHSLTDDPSAADLIVFAELYGAGAYFQLVRQHPFVKNFREKCFLFCSNDFVIPFLPGVFASIEKRWSSARTRAGFYLGVSENEFVDFTAPNEGLMYLYSFLGTVDTAPVRRKLTTLSHPRSFFQDTSADYRDVLSGKLDAAAMQQYWRRYGEICKLSKFILCPRGMGTSSVRLFDTMRMGRVPVILSDQWVEPKGPCWEKFSLRVPEADFARIPALLEEREGAAVEMGLLSRAQWEEWFSEKVCFHRIVEWCLDIKKRRRISEAWARFFPYIQYLRPFHFRHLLRTEYHAWQRTKRRAGSI